MLFSERYDENICDELDIKVKGKIADLMCKFAEPQIDFPNRYDNFEVITDALSSAISAFEEQKNFSFCSSCYNENFSYQSTIYIFDVIELQYEELSVNERSAFQDEMNGVFSCYDIPWVLCNGRLIKIDSKQFEMDLANKALKIVKELNELEPKFSSAYEELIKAFDFFEKGNYQEAISNAGKSYESILKVILGADRGNADKLTNQYMERLLVIPATMRPEGFREKVMMSLPYMRNNSGADHGAGAINVTINKHFAKLAINLAAALDTYLIEEYQAELAKKTPQGTSTVSEDNNNEYPF